MLRIEIALYGHTSIEHGGTTPEEIREVARIHAAGDKAFIKCIIGAFDMAVEEVEAF